MKGVLLTCGVLSEGKHHKRVGQSLIHRLVSRARLWRVNDGCKTTFCPFC